MRWKIVTLSDDGRALVCFNCAVTELKRSLAREGRRKMPWQQIEDQRRRGSFPEEPSLDTTVWVAGEAKTLGECIAEDLERGAQEDAEAGAEALANAEWLRAQAAVLEGGES